MVKRKAKKCALCGREIRRNRYILRIICYVAYDGLEIHLEDMSRDFTKMIKEEIRKIKKLSKKRLLDEIAKWWEFLLCPACAEKYRRNPIKNQISKMKKLKVKNEV